MEITRCLGGLAPFSTMQKFYAAAKVRITSTILCTVISSIHVGINLIDLHRIKTNLKNIKIYCELMIE